MAARQFAVRACLAVLAILIAGCGATEKFLSEHQTPREEKITSFLVSTDYKKLVGIGDDYHYVLDIQNPQELEGILKARWRSSVEVHDIEIDVYDNQTVRAHVFLKIPGRALSDPDRQNAAELGFGFMGDANGPGFYALHLTGIRYSAGNFRPHPEMKSESVSYTAHVFEGPSKLAKALLTPLTMTADGALLIAGAPVLVVLGICGDNGCVK
jgi:hypothetical protein